MANLIEKQREIDALWWDIQDIIGSADSWPKWIVNMFFTENLNHAKCPLISAFVIFNGLNPEVRISISSVFFNNISVTFVA